MSDDDDDLVDTQLETPAPAQITLTINGKERQVAYEQAFAFGCSLLKKGRAAEAAKLFQRLEEFTDRGPRAFIMQAFCEAAALNFDDCSRPLSEAFSGEKSSLVGTLHNAFISYHVGIRQDALNSMFELVNKHHDLPTLALLLGDMLETAGRVSMAQKCWSLAVHRDRQGGSVAAVAMRQLQRYADQPDTDTKRTAG